MELDRLNSGSCSIGCYESHQTTHSTVSPLTTISNDLPPESSAAIVFTGTLKSHTDSHRPSSGTRSPSSLESSADLELLYTRYPQLRDQLKEIYEAATKPLKDQLKNHLLDSEHSDRRWGRGRTGELARDGRATAKWSRHNGIKSGIHKLRILRNLKDVDGDGDGLREFSKLITDPFKARRSTIDASQTR